VWCWCIAYFDILNRFSVTHNDHDGRTDILMANAINHYLTITLLVCHILYNVAWITAVSGVVAKEPKEPMLTVP